MKHFLPSVPVRERMKAVVRHKVAQERMAEIRDHALRSALIKAPVGPHIWTPSKTTVPSRRMPGVGNPFGMPQPGWPVDPRRAAPAGSNDGNVSANGAATFTRTIDYVLLPGSNRMLFAGMQVEGDGDSSGASMANQKYGTKDKTAAFPQITNFDGGASETQFTCCWLEADLPADGTNTFTIDITSAVLCQGCHIFVIQFNSVAQVVPSSALLSQVAAETTSVIPSVDNSTVLLLGLNNSAGSDVTVGGFNQIYDGDAAGDNRPYAFYADTVSAGSITGTANVSNRSVTSMFAMGPATPPPPATRSPYKDLRRVGHAIVSFG